MGEPKNASEEGYSAGKSGESADSNPYKNDTVTGRMGSIIGDVLTGNISDSTQQQDQKADDWDSGHGAGGKDKDK